MSRNAPYHTLPRLFVEAPLEAGGRAPLNVEQTHYLLHVMRVQPSDSVRLFNGRDGEWQAEIPPLETHKKKHGLDLILRDAIRPQHIDNPLFLFCAPIKKASFDSLIAKATELGVTHIQPLVTARTQVRDVNPERCRAIAIEAAEQSERLMIPSISSPISLERMVAAWPKDALPIVCAEWGEALPVGQAFFRINIKKGLHPVVITGPEGGFTDKELPALLALPNALPIRLGPRILRADTAALAALTCFQALCGDWK